jgi:toxin ParE1/3/4
MATVTYSELAEMDLLEIWQYITEDSLVNADKFIDYLDEKCRLLAKSPRMGESFPNSARGFLVFL